jgi:hypothetical protein
MDVIMDKDIFIQNHVHMKASLKFLKLTTAKFKKSVPISKHADISCSP